MLHCSMLAVRSARTRHLQQQETTVPGLAPKSRDTGWNHGNMAECPALNTHAHTHARTLIHLTHQVQATTYH